MRSGRENTPPTQKSSPRRSNSSHRHSAYGIEARSKGWSGRPRAPLVSVACRWRIGCANAPPQGGERFRGGKRAKAGLTDAHRLSHHPPMPGYIHVKGARQHNLDVAELFIPKKQLVVFTGVSGSGKSSLAFDTIYAEGQRRYVESLSSYARQFLGQLEKPIFDHIRGLSPTIAIEQKATSNNPRSTVGTLTEIHDYLRVLYARVGTQYCHHCDVPVEPLGTQEIVDRIASTKARVTLLAPVVENRKGTVRRAVRGPRAAWLRSCASRWRDPAH